MQAQFSEQTRRALSDARLEASENASACVEPEHLLVAVLRADHSEACAELRRSGHVPKAIYDDVCALLDVPLPVAERAAPHPPESIVLSAHSERVLSTAARIAAQFGRYHMGTDHLLMALIAEPNETLAGVWKRHNVSASEATATGERIAPTSAMVLAAAPRQLHQRPAWNRYTFAAKQAISHAATEARQSGHNRLLPPFLLAGILHESDTVTANALRRMGAGRNDLRVALADALEPGTDGDLTGNTGREMTFGSRALAALTESERIAQTLGDRHIGTEHLLLGLLAGEGETATLLKNRGIVSANFLDALRSVKRGNTIEGKRRTTGDWVNLLFTVLMFAAIVYAIIASSAR